MKCCKCHKNNHKATKVALISSLCRQNKKKYLKNLKKTLSKKSCKIKKENVRHSKFKFLSKLRCNIINSPQSTKRAELGLPQIEIKIAISKIALHPFNTIFEKMAKAQKICDKEMRGIRSSNCYFNRINKDKIDRIKRAKNIIQDLECHGPAGLIHIGVLSNIIGKPIQIWNPNGSLNRIIGNRKMGRPIDIEYHATDSEQIGHWTLKYGKDPDNISIDLNSCLFSVIGSQIKRDPSELREWTVLRLKSKFRKLVNLINEILKLEKNGEIILMIGGARYCGTSPKHAKIILDNSQDHKCHGFPNPGHPRGHAYHPSGFSIVNYSLNSVKTGFPTRADQDYVTHLALKTQVAQKAMADLNDDKISVTISLTPNELGNSGNLPRVIKYSNGIEKTGGNMREVVLVLRHHEGQRENPDADVFVQTCFPTLA